MTKIKIGVFDSGMGGLSVANSIQKALPDYEIVYRQDKEHVPYGSKPVEEVFGYVQPILQKMIDDGCSLIVIACNTVTTTLIGPLREIFPIPLVGIEPMVKPAARATRSMIIAVCATPTTLHSQQYKNLKAEFAKNVKVLEPDCSDWASMIEHGATDDEMIENRVNTVIEQGADVIVLACTHYHWIEKKIRSLALGRAKVIQPEQAIIRQVKRVLETL